MAAGDVRNSRRFRELARLLREQAYLHDVTMVEGEAEQLLGHRVADIAQQLGITERTALTTYMTQDFISQLARQLGSMAADYRQATSDAEPVALEIARAVGVIAALGMVIKLAIMHVADTRTESAGIIADVADVLVQFGAEIRGSQQPAHVTLGGHELVLARSILGQAIDLLRTNRWECPADRTRQEHPAR